MKLLNLNICIKIDNTGKIIELLKEEDPVFGVLQEVMNGVDESCFEMYKAKNRLIEIKRYPFNSFAPLYIAKGISKNGNMIRDFGGRAEQGSLVLSKYNIIEDINQFYYNEYKYEYDATEFREKDWCRSIQNVIVDIDGKNLQIINIHGIWTENKTDDDRIIDQADFILSQLRDDIPCILVGDFNLLPETYGIKMIESKMRNLIKEYDIKTTRPIFDDGLDKGNIICDYIFVNDKVKVNNFKVLDSYVSDHFPLVLDFEI